MNWRGAFDTSRANGALSGENRRPVFEGRGGNQRFMIRHPEQLVQSSSDWVGTRSQLAAPRPHDSRLEIRWPG